MKPYPVTLEGLRRDCPLLAKIEVIGRGSDVQGCTYVKGTEQLVGRNARGEIIVQSTPGTVTPAKVKKFTNDYQHAVAVGIIKRFTQEEEPHA